MLYEIPLQNITYKTHTQDIIVREESEEK